MPSLPPEIREQIETQLKCEVIEFLPIGGGCINHAGKIRVKAGNYFLKWNERWQFPEMISLEASGLQLLAASKSIRIPDVIVVGETEHFQFLVLEFLESGPRAKDYWTIFGSQLACLHRQASTYFGLAENNYIGSLKQHNESSPDWINFFITNRLEPQLKTAVDRQIFPDSIIGKFQQLYKNLQQLLPQEKPSLLHGDLWSGNLITDEHGRPCLIDPAVYYGNREVDLAMTKLFGGFDPGFLVAYHAEYPLLPGFDDRCELYNLYPLLVHVNLFGGNYPAQVVSILNRFV